MAKKNPAPKRKIKVDDRRSTYPIGATREIDTPKGKRTLKKIGEQVVDKWQFFKSQKKGKVH